MNIITLLNQIKAREIVLPAIQRNFVWTTDRVTMLLDSIMRGYRVGIALLWETYADIPYRRFVEEYQPEGKHNFTTTSSGRSSRSYWTGSSVSNPCLWRYTALTTTSGYTSTS
jgi:uncharacterized protein with ParB-like and HNH nuclease domain